MRKLIVALGAAALLTAPAALAKERNITVIVPTSSKAGKAVMATISVKMDGRYTPGKTPVIRIINSAGKVVTIRSLPTAKAGIYRARLMFPAAGVWRVLVVDRETGRSYEFHKVRAT
jgi:hypothetical protein